MDAFIRRATVSDATSPPLWVVLRGDDILLGGGSVLFEEGPLREGGFAPERGVALGLLGSRPVFVTQAASDAADPRFVPLRAALTAVGPDAFGFVSLAAQLWRFERTHAHCGCCGAPTTPVAGEHAKTCARCNLTVYPPVSPAIIVLVHDEAGRILLARRRRMSIFALVAGFVESGESLEECLSREVDEEVGVRVDDLRYFGSQPWPFPHQIMVGFFARWCGGEVRADGVEIDEARWFEVGALPALPPPISIARRMIDRFAAAPASGRK